MKPVLLILGASLMSGATALADSAITEFIDPAGDALVRRTDAGNNGPLSAGAVLPDLVSVRVGRWIAPNAPADVYEGEFTTLVSARLVRLDLVFQGLVNPPGSLGLGYGSFHPFAFGPSPLYGFVEVDMDLNRDTGGELGDAAGVRYLANVGRFGEVVDVYFSDRMARMGVEIDQAFSTAPQVERSGADFALAFCGCFDVTVTSTKKAQNGIFEAGDRWIVRGRFLQRAGGFEEASAAYGGSFFGLYDPVVDLCFSHDEMTDQTTVSLVYPLDMEGAAMMLGEPVQPLDLDVANHNSIEEAMDDVIIGSKKQLTSPTAALTASLQNLTPQVFLEPSAWRITAIVGTSYATQDPQGALYVWTDAMGPHMRGDFNSDGVVGPADEAALAAWIWALDGTAGDADGVVNGEYRLANPGPDFCVYDLDGDGTVSMADFPSTAEPLTGDADHNCVVNFDDVTCVLTHWGEQYAPGAAAAIGDANGDFIVSFDDITAVISNWNVTCP